MFPGPESAADELDIVEEGKLVEAALQGDHAAFTELVLHNQGKLYRSMLRLSKSTDIAEDLVQDAFVQAYLKLDQFAGRCRFHTWLFRIGYNRFLVQRRRRPMSSIEGLQEMGALNPVDQTDSAERVCERAELRQQVGLALERLDRESRRILILREMKGLSYEQIGESLEIKLGTVRSRLSRARSKLVLELEKTQDALECS